MWLSRRRSNDSAVVSFAMMMEMLTTTRNGFLNQSRCGKDRRTEIASGTWYDTDPMIGT